MDFEADPSAPFGRSPLGPGQAGFAWIRLRSPQVPSSDSQARPSAPFGRSGFRILVGCSFVKEQQRRANRA